MHIREPETPLWVGLAVAGIVGFLLGVLATLLTVLSSGVSQYSP